MQSHQGTHLCRCFISLVLSYVLILLSVPFAPAASANRDRTEPSKTSGSFPVPSPQQNIARHRSGELLIRFRNGLSEQDKAVAIASQGARRKGQLRGESAIEKLELATGQNPDTAAQHLSLNPAIEFAEPNFLINHDELRPEAKMFPVTGQPKPLFEPRRLSAEFSSSNPGMAVIPQAQGIQPNDARFAEEWALRNTGQGGGQFGSDINVTSAWQRTTGSPATVIAVIDSGIDFRHPDLVNNKWPGSREALLMTLTGDSRAASLLSKARPITVTSQTTPYKP